MIKRARISTDGQYRYTLTRVWDETKPYIVFVMLNPSTADASEDDPTIKRCIEFAKREGCGALHVVNLFAYRATEPMQMRRAVNPVGTDNDATLIETFKKAAYDKATVVGAWGTNGWHMGRDTVVEALAATSGLALKCFGQNRDGSPKHPLYIKGDQPLVDML